MCGGWWISILGLCQFLCVCSLSILAVRLKAMKNAILNGRKNKKANTIERNRQE